MTVDVATSSTDVWDLRQRLLQVISEYYDRPVILRLELYWIQTARPGLAAAPGVFEKACLRHFLSDLSCGLGWQNGYN